MGCDGANRARGVAQGAHGVVVVVDATSGEFAAVGVDGADDRGGCLHGGLVHDVLGLGVVGRLGICELVPALVDGEEELDALTRVGAAGGGGVADARRALRDHLGGGLRERAERRGVGVRDGRRASDRGAETIAARARRRGAEGGATGCRRAGDRSRRPARRERRVSSRRHRAGRADGCGRASVEPRETIDDSSASISRKRNRYTPAGIPSACLTTRARRVPPPRPHPCATPMPRETRAAGARGGAGAKKRARKPASGASSRRARDREASDHDDADANATSFPPSTLPPEVLDVILSLLDHDSAFQCALVCRAWRDVALAPDSAAARRLLADVVRANAGILAEADALAARAPETGHPDPLRGDALARWEMPRARATTPPRRARDDHLRRTRRQHEPTRATTTTTTTTATAATATTTSPRQLYADVCAFACYDCREMRDALDPAPRAPRTTAGTLRVRLCVTCSRGTPGGDPPFSGWSRRRREGTVRASPRRSRGVSVRSGHESGRSWFRAHETVSKDGREDGGDGAVGERRGTGGGAPETDAGRSMTTRPDRGEGRGRRVGVL